MTSEGEDAKNIPNPSPIQASVNVTLDGVVAMKPGPPWSYLGVAESMCRGVVVMAEHGNSGLALPLVAAHTLECALKAFLSRNGDEGQLKNIAVRHNLEELWRLARKEHLPIDEIPAWAINLSNIHNAPFHLRYASMIHAIATPAPEPMATELVALIGVVRQSIHAHRRVDV